MCRYVAARPLGHRATVRRPQWAHRAFAARRVLLDGINEHDVARVPYGYQARFNGCADITRGARTLRRGVAYANSARYAGRYRYFGGQPDASSQRSASSSFFRSAVFTTSAANDVTFPRTRPGTPLSTKSPSAW